MPVSSSDVTQGGMIENGKKVFESCYNGVVPLPNVPDAKGFAGQTMKMFNDYWGGLPELSMREKRMVVMGGLLASGNGAMFAIHAESALRNKEIDADTLRAIIFMSLPYVGYPNASPCYLEAEKLIARIAQESDT